MATSTRVPPLPLGSTLQQNARAAHNKPQQLGFANGVAIVRSAEERTTKRQPSSAAQDAQDGVAPQPAWLAFDRQTLCFNAYFQEAVHEKREENFRVRECKIYFFPEDDTIEVIEPRKENSGIPQGKLLRRHRVPKPAPEDDDYYRVEDLNVGNEVTFYGRTFLLCSCDPFTRNFLTKLGMEVGNEQQVPTDPYSTVRKQMKEAEISLRPYERQDKLKQFLDHDRKVLRFYAVWDDVSADSGERRYMVLHYFLADDTVEIREVQQTNSGRDGPGVFLKRQKLPRPGNQLVQQPGDVTSRTLLNVFAKSGLTGRHILDSLHQGDGKPPHYTQQDLEIGNELSVFGRNMLLCDCDEFTKQYYRDNYGVEDFTPVQLEEEADVVIEHPIPPHTGIGSEQDSMVSVKHLILKPPKKEFSKWFKEGASALQFSAKLDTTNALDADRIFSISYYLADDSIAVFEQRIRNSGIVGGKFLERRQVKHADGTRNVNALDFSLGGIVELNRFRFLITDASAFAFKYFTEAQHPESNVNSSLAKCRADNEGRQDDLTAAIMTLDQGSGTAEMKEFERKLCENSPSLTPHEARTISLRFGQDDPQNAGVAVADFIAQVFA